MNLFDDRIKEILDQINLLTPLERATLKKPSRIWTDVGEHHMILGKEMAYELGGQGTFGLSGCFYTTEPILFPRGSLFIWKGFDTACKKSVLCATCICSVGGDCQRGSTLSKVSRDRLCALSYPPRRVHGAYLSS